MVDRDIAARGVRDQAVLEAMGSVPRERFVSDRMADVAYDDRPLPIADRQTISQPFMVARMTEAAEIGPDDRVLEVGAGSGYGAAVASRLADEVWAIERHEALALGAAAVLQSLGYDNAHVVRGDGTLGYRAAAPFDAIIVTAGGPKVPEALLTQLADGGRLVMPVGAGRAGQELIRLRRRSGRYRRDRLGPVRFVPLIGEQGYSSESAE